MTVSARFQVFADPSLDSGLTANALFNRLRPEIEAIHLPEGYELTWGGEYESSTDAQKSLFASLPLGYLVMFIITVLLFSELRSALVIWACVPLAIIGVTAGMLLLGAEFGFMSLLGILSLSGMIVKNGIVLVDQIRIEEASGKPGYDAVFEASISRLRPVMMAALTTILGMMPLLTDPFFQRDGGRDKLRAWICDGTDLRCCTGSVRHGAQNSAKVSERMTRTPEHNRI